MKIWWARTVISAPREVRQKGGELKLVCLATEYVLDQFRGGGRGEEKGILSSSCSYDLRTKLNILRKNKGNHTHSVHTHMHTRAHTVLFEHTMS